MPDWVVNVVRPQTTESHPDTPVFAITTPTARGFDGKLENLDLYRTFREHLTMSLTNAVALPRLDYPAPQDWLEPTLIPTGRTLADIAPALEAAARALQLPEPDERKNATFSSQLELTPIGTFPNFTGLEVSVWRTMTSRAGTMRLACSWALFATKADLDKQPHVIVYSSVVGRMDGEWLGVDHRRQLVRTVFDAVGSQP